MIIAWETSCEVSLLLLLFVCVMRVTWLLFFYYQPIRFEVLYLFNLIRILKLHVFELISCRFHSHRKVIVDLCAELPWSFSSFTFACAAWICCSITFVHIIPLYFADNWILICYCPVFFWPLVWLLLSENSLFYLIKLIMSGDIDSTFKRLREWYPQVIKVYSLVVDLIYHHPVISRKNIWQILSLK